MHDGFISWQQFVKQPHVARLSINEQTAQLMYGGTVGNVQLLATGSDIGPYIPSVIVTVNRVG